MRQTAALLLAALVSLPAVASDEPERDHTSKSFDLADGASIEVSGIAGPVEIDTGAGTTADVDIVRSAPTREDLDCGGVMIVQSPTKLQIRSVDRCSIVRQSQHVRLRVPRSADLSLKNIAGAVRVSPTDGMLRLESIAGHVEAAGLSETRMSSLAGGLELNLSGIGRRGIRVSSVTGGIDIGVPAGLDADLTIRSVVGRVHGDAAGLRFVEESDSDHHAVLGSGGPEILLESVVGSVRIHN